VVVYQSQDSNSADKTVTIDLTMDPSVSLHYWRLLIDTVFFLYDICKTLTPNLTLWQTCWYH